MTEKTFDYFLPISKVEKNDDGSRTVVGYASTERIDLDGEIVSLDAVKSALPSYMEWRNIRLMHQPIPIGIAKEAHTDDHGLYVKSRIVEPSAVALIDEGVLKGYSIGGKKLAKNGNTITKLELVEISLVDRPANPDCRVDVTKMMKGAVETGAFEVEPDEVGFLRKMVSKLLNGSELAKREFSQKARDEAADDGAAMPGGGYPIESEQDVKNAVQAFGRAKDKEATKAHIIQRAKKLGATQHLPADWEGSTKAEVKKAARPTDWDDELFGSFGEATVPAALLEFAKSAEAGDVLPAPVIERLEKGMQTVGDLCYAFASLRGAQRRLIMEGMVEKDGDDQKLADRLGSIAKELASVISEKADHEGSEALFLTDEDDLAFYGFNGNYGVFEMSEQSTDLQKRATARVRENVGKAASHLRKAGKANVEAQKCFGKACKIFGERMKKAAAEGDEDTMKVLKAARDAMSEASDHMEMAHGALGKAASGWVGQREQGAMSPGDGYHENPKFVDPLDQGTMTEGEVPWYESDEPYVGKAAQARPAVGPGEGYVTKSEAEALARAAAAEAKVEVLSKSPANPRRAIVGTGGEALAGLGGGSEGGDKVSLLLKGVDTDAEDAAGTMIGNMIANKNKFAKSLLFDESFRGQAGAKRS